MCWWQDRKAQSKTGSRESAHAAGEQDLPCVRPRSDSRGSMAGTGGLHGRAIHNHVGGRVIEFGRSPRHGVLVVAAREQNLAGIGPGDKQGRGRPDAALHPRGGNFGRKPIRHRIVQIDAAIVWSAGDQDLSPSGFALLSARWPRREYKR